MGERVDEVKADRQVLGAAITTGVVTASVVPFVREMTRRAAGDSYAALRSWLKRMFHDARGEEDGVADPATTTLLIVQDPGSRRSLIVEPCLPNAAIRALGELDVEKLFDEAGSDGVAVFFDMAAGCWRADRT